MVKKSREIIDLPIVGIEEGTRLGRVKSLLVNPAQKRVQYLLTEVADRPGEALLLPFERVMGVGEHALTIEKRSAMESVDRFPEAVDLLLKNVQVTGLAVLDNKGALQGTIGEYLVDEESGTIAGCFPAGAASEGLIPAAAIITYSPSYVIVKHDFRLVGEEALTAPPAPAAPPEQAKTENENENENGFDTFVTRQKDFLLGRTLTNDIVDAEGQVVAREGEVVTEKLMEKVIAADKYIELTMSTK